MRVQLLQQLAVTCDESRRLLPGQADLRSMTLPLHVAAYQVINPCHLYMHLLVLEADQSFRMMQLQMSSFMQADYAAPANLMLVLGCRSERPVRD